MLLKKKSFIPNFINECHWAEVLKLIRPGNFVIIQFGHHDEKDDITRHTDPGTTFDGNLTRYCMKLELLEAYQFQ